MLSRATVIISILTLFLLFKQEAYAQSDSSVVDKILLDSTQLDTATASVDTITKPKNVKKNKQAIDSPIMYSASDSMSILVGSQTVRLWGKGQIKYQDIELKADRIVSDLENQEVYAAGVYDTSGIYSGVPNFKKGNEQFDSDSILYNTKTGKGIIYSVKTEQGEGYLHSDLTKRDALGHVHMKGGKYTTCDADHPHFYMELTKAIAIPGDKIISGPAYMVVQDVPVPLLGLPFGFFPSSEQRGAGVIIPKYGEELTRGFYLRNGGWYQPIGQYVDVQLLGDIYTKGSWALHFASSYKVRYKFNGNMRVDYNVNDDNEDDFFVKRTDFKWTWNHRKDAKANPTQSFSASVNFSSSGYDKSNSYNYNDVVTNQKSSSISFTKSFPGTPFNLALSANARQNTRDSTLTMALPKGSFNASTIYPFRNKSGSGKLKWYENIGFSYNSEFGNEMHMKDTMLFESETWEDLNYGLQHSIPLSINLKTEKIKMLTITPAMSYRGVLNSRYINRYAVLDEDGVNETIATDTIYRPSYAHAVNPSIRVGLTPKVTGMYLNTRENPNVIAVRHVMQPRASFSYVPDISEYMPSYYDTVKYTVNGEERFQRYSKYDVSLYGAPSAGKKSGSLSLGLSNTLDMKVRPKNDTTGEAEPQKVSLLRNFNFNTSYNPFADEFKWSDVSFTTGSSLFKKKLNLNLTSRFSPYDIALDESSSTPTYVKVNEFYLSKRQGIGALYKLKFIRIIHLKIQER